MPEQCQSHVYLVPEFGHILCHRSYPSGRLAPVRAILQISLTGKPFATVVDDVRYNTVAHVTRPAWIEIHSGGAPIACFAFYTYGEMFRSMRLLPSPFIEVPRQLFNPLDGDLDKALQGNLDIADARRLFADAITILKSILPPAPPADPRIQCVIDMLTEDSNTPMHDLAKAVSLSPDRLSHLFTQTVGINVRRQRLALKLIRSILIFRPGMSMSELASASGFSDSAHMSRASTEVFGAPPTYFVNNTVVHHESALSQSLNNS